MKEENDQGAAGVYLPFQRQRLQSPSRPLHVNVLWKKFQLDDMRPSSRKYPYIDFRPNREIGNEVLMVENLSKTIDGVKVPGQHLLYPRTR